MIAGFPAVEHRRELIPIEKILIPSGRRQLRDDKVRSLAASIAKLGLLEPIGVTPEYRLVFGLHRVEACKLCGLSEVPVVVISTDELHTELAEIDENVERNALTALEWSEHLQRRKQIYESLNPETRRGGDRREQTDKMSVCKTQGAPSFAADTAAKTGLDERTVRRAVKIAEDLPQDVRDQVRNTPVAESKADLQKLASMSEAQQRKVAKKVAAGAAKAVRNAGKERNRKSAAKSGAESIQEILADAAREDEDSEPLTPEQECEQHNSAIEGFCRKLHAFFEGERPKLPWVTDGLVNSAKGNLKACCDTFRGVKCAVCPACEGGGCSECKQNGYLPKGNAAQLGRVRE